MTDDKHPGRGPSVAKAPFSEEEIQLRQKKLDLVGYFARIGVEQVQEQFPDDADWGVDAMIIVDNVGLIHLMKRIPSSALIAALRQLVKQTEELEEEEAWVRTTKGSTE